MLMSCVNDCIFRFCMHFDTHLCTYIHSYMQFYVRSTLHGPDHLLYRSFNDYININSSVPEGKLMGVELIGVYKSGSINWG